MKPTSNVVLALLLSAVLASACNKSPETPKVETPAATDKSVALPPNTVPRSDASIPPPSANASGSGDANSPTQANPTQLQKSQEQSAMPTSGQANTHSTPETGGQPK